MEIAISKPTSEDLAGLAQRSHAGDGAAQRQLCDQLRSTVRAIARRMAGHPDDVEDLSQSIFMAVFRGLASFRAEAGFTTWLQAVARNEGRKFLRRRQRRDLPMLDADRHPDELPAQEPPDRFERHRLCRAVEQLPSAERLALERVAFDGLSYVEAADQLGCTAAAVRGRLYRARTLLRQQLGEAP